MHKFKAQGLVEFILVGILITVSLFIVVPILGGKIQGIFAHTKHVKNNSATTLVKSTNDPIASLKQSFDIKFLDYKNSQGNVDKRIEATGALGLLIAEYNTGNDNISKAIISDMLNELALVDEYSLTEQEVDDCIESPSSCKTLMTISDFYWTPNNTNAYLNDVYCLIKGKGDLKDPLPITLFYTNTYIDDNGKTATQEVNQSVSIQKEQFRQEKYRDKKLQYFLDDYMPTTFSDELFTGSAVKVEEQSASYIKGKNNVLSTSKSQKLDF